jgi:transcriptional regulator with XRE-family HTH domain
MSIGERLKLLRESRGFNKKEVSDRLEMPYTTYNNYETDARDVGSETLRKIAQFYNVTIDHILENEQPREETYYADAETDALAEALHKTPGMRILFDASRDLNKDDLEFLATMAKKMKGDSDE